MYSRSLDLELKTTPAIISSIIDDRTLWKTFQTVSYGVNCRRLVRPYGLILVILESFLQATWTDGKVQSSFNLFQSSFNTQFSPVA